jgi:hypothetical protein
MVGRQVGYPIATSCMVGRQVGYPIATICRMTTWLASKLSTYCHYFGWWAGRLATLLSLIAGCPRGVPAGWLPYCHYLQDDHVVCRQAGYPIATICRMPTWCAGRLATLLPLLTGYPHNGLASLFPCCHYLQDDHMVGWQVGYPIATILDGGPAGWLPYTV